MIHQRRFRLISNCYELRRLDRAIEGGCAWGDRQTTLSEIDLQTTVQYITKLDHEMFRWFKYQCRLVLV